MRAGISPDIGHVLHPQRGIAAQDINVARLEPPRLHQKPDRDAGANYVGLAAVHFRSAFNTGKGIRSQKSDLISTICSNLLSPVLLLTLRRPLPPKRRSYMASTSVLRLRRAAGGVSRQVPRRVQVPVQHHTAVAPIRANVQRHRLNPATTATQLRGRKPATGLYEAHVGRPALVLELTDEAAHASIRHGTRQPTVLHHAAHVQVFHDNTRCAPHDLRTGLVLGVTAQAGRPVMSRRQFVPPALARFDALWRP